MEERHKKILQRNRTNLVRDLDPSNLYDGLLEKEVFTQDMIDEIKVRRQRRALTLFLLLSVGWPVTVCLPPELRDQTGPGQAAGAGPGDPRESGLPTVPGVPPGDRAARVGGAPAGRASSCSTAACSTHPGGPPGRPASPSV